MDSFVRLVLRFLVVPSGLVVAGCFAATVVIFGQWQAFVAAANDGPNAEGHIFALMFLAPWMVMIFAGSALLMLSPSVIGIVIAEAFAIRSWLYHVGNGALSAFIGWSMLEGAGPPDRVFTDPKLVVVAGIVAGFAYWLVAGWSAGFWKPVFAREPARPSPPAVADR